MLNHIAWINYDTSVMLYNVAIVMSGKYIMNRYELLSKW